MKKNLLRLFILVAFSFLTISVIAGKMPTPLTVYANYPDDIHNEACSESTGFIHPNAYGGLAPYTFLWSNSATTQNIDNIPAGIYTITVTDAASTTATASWTITS